MYNYLDFINFEDSDRDENIDYLDPDTYSNGIDYNKTIEENKQILAKVSRELMR